MGKRFQATAFFNEFLGRFESENRAPYPGDTVPFKTQPIWDIWNPA